MLKTILVTMFLVSVAAKGADTIYCFEPTTDPGEGFSVEITGNKAIIEEEDKFVSKTKVALTEPQPLIEMIFHFVSLAKSYGRQL